MKTEFKIFESDLGYYKVEELIKEKKEKHNAEIKNVVLIRDNDVETIIGAIFEKRSEDENKWIRRRINRTRWVCCWVFRTANTRTNRVY